MVEAISHSSIGSLFVLLAQGPAFFVHSLAKALQSGNYGEHSVPTLQIITCRMVLTLIPGLLYLYFKSVPNFILGNDDVRYLLAIRAAAGTIGVGGFYGTSYILIIVVAELRAIAKASMIYLPLVEATIISFLSPLLTTIVSTMVAGSHLSLRQIGASCICFSGVLCVTLPKLISHKDENSEPENSAKYPAQGLGLLIALVGVIGSSVTILCVRKIGTQAHPLITMNYLAYFVLSISFIVPFLSFDSLAYSWDLRLIDWIMLFGVGLFAFIMEVLQTYGFALDSSPKAINMLYSQAILAFGADILVWKTDFSGFSIFGVAAVIIGLILMDNRLPSENDSRFSMTVGSTISLQDMDRVSNRDLVASEEMA